MAERLLAMATASPALIGRSDPVDPPPDERSADFPALALLSDPALDVRPYLDELATAAVAAARQAEDLSEQARASIQKAGRASLLLGCFGALGLLIGAAGFAAGISFSATLAQIRIEVAALQDRQRQAQDALATLISYQANLRLTQPTPLTDTAGLSGLGSVSPAPPAVKPPNIHYYAQPWPDSRLSTRQVAVTRNPQATSSDPFLWP